MADGSNRARLPWGMTSDSLKPNSVQVKILNVATLDEVENKINSFFVLQSISQQKLKAFSLGMMNPLKRAAMKKKEEKKIDKKIVNISTQL